MSFSSFNGLKSQNNASHKLTIPKKYDNEPVIPLPQALAKQVGIDRGGADKTGKPDTQIRDIPMHFSGISLNNFHLNCVILLDLILLDYIILEVDGWMCI